AIADLDARPVAQHVTVQSVTAEPRARIGGVDPHAHGRAIFEGVEEAHEELCRLTRFTVTIAELLVVHDGPRSVGSRPVSLAANGLSTPTKKPPPAGRLAGAGGAQRGDRAWSRR